MERELRVHMDFYLKMKEGESVDEAYQRFDKLMESLSDSNEEHESSYQVYIYEERKN